ncbi:hypothetical protein Hypma_009326 [Hypsizygus marmoreus]|uniref:Uncharacterized protein n=1 Tax=Hypsizygus marmoreus TaxID=39966 RepID=A0A369JMW5_HYPMA|nr:hypothetical protein Hypma_009326 [Hypsizygus marmoreus]
MHPVCSISELLEMIFSTLDDQANASNAQVCKQWGECALNVMWRDVTDFRRLLCILAPLKKLQDISSGPGTASIIRYMFARPPEASDWKRFDRYRHRVRRLLCSIQPTPKCAIDLSVFDDIARTRTSLNIFPNLLTLRWNTRLHSCIVFMHENVTDVRLCFAQSEQGSTGFREVAFRMPRITRLELQANFSSQPLAAEAISMIRGLKSLREVILPRYMPTAGLYEALSGLPDLDTVSASHWLCNGSHPRELAVTRPPLTGDAFQSLSHLETGIRFDDAIYLFNLLSDASKVRTLRLDSPEHATPACIQDLLVVTARLMPFLEELQLVSCLCNFTITDDPVVQNSIITVHTLRPLFKCSHIRILRLLLPHPVSLLESDVEELARAWPALENLALNSQPKYISHCPLDIRALVHLARHCPELAHVALFIGAAIPTPGSAVEYPVFRKLELFHAGFSDIDDPGAIALFLSRILPLGSGVCNSVLWGPTPNLLPTIVRTILGRIEKWKKVNEILPLLLQARLEERERKLSVIKSKGEGSDCL